MKQLTRSAGRLKKVFMLLLCMSIMTVPAMSGAEGGIMVDEHYSTKVTNKTDGDVEVGLWYGLTLIPMKQTIAKGNSYTFNTVCPFALSCDRNHGITITCTGGGRTVQSTSECSAACLNSDWEVKKRSDGSYYFDRQ